jgi:hypothetical protein
MSFCYADRKCFKLTVGLLFMIKIFSLKKYMYVLAAHYQTGKGNEIKA